MAFTRPEDDPVIAEYRSRRQEFKPLWNRTFLFFAFPGFALIAAGEGWLEQPWMAWLGVPLFLAALARGFLLSREYLRCPQCDAFQGVGGVQFPYHSCRSCKARLSVGARDQF